MKSAKKAQAEELNEFMGTLAKDIMSTNLITLTERATVEEALKIFINARVTGVPIVNDQSGKLVGVLSEFDIIRLIGGKKKLQPKLFNQPIRYSKKAKSIQATTPLEEIINLFVEFKYRRLPVVDEEERLVGVITRRDLMRIFFYRSKLP
ncbi:MAG: HPP family protein [Oligoflexia bacterium]